MVPPTHKVGQGNNPIPCTEEKSLLGSGNANDLMASTGNPLPTAIKNQLTIIPYISWNIFFFPNSYPLSTMYSSLQNTTLGNDKLQRIFLLWKLKRTKLHLLPRAWLLYPLVHIALSPQTNHFPLIKSTDALLNAFHRIHLILRTTLN